MERKNKIKVEAITIVATLFYIFITIGFASAQSMPLSIHGTVYELDGVTQVPQGTFIFINDTTSGYYAEGKTGTFFNSGRYTASVQGNDGDEVVITASNGFNDVSLAVTLSGSMRNVNLLLNTTVPPQENHAPEIVTQPLTQAFFGVFYRYDVNAFDADGDSLTYSLLENPPRMAINPSTGVIEWLPRIRDFGRKRVVVKVEDGRNGTDIQEFEIRVRIKIRDINITEFYLKLIENESLDGKNYLIKINSSENYKFENEDVTVREIKIENAVLDEAYLILKEFNKRPSEIKDTFRKVYKYIQIYPLNINSEEMNNISFVFRVDKDWIKNEKSDNEDIGLARFTEGKWYYFAPKVEKEDNNFVYYNVDVNGLDNLVIFVGEFKNWKSFENLVELPYFIVGTVFEKDGKTQADRGTKIKIKNENNGEEIDLETGIGPMNGAYATFLNWKEGDKLRISISGGKNSQYEFTLRQKGNEIDFKKNIWGDYRPKKENILKSTISDVFSYLGDLFG